MISFQVQCISIVYTSNACVIVRTFFSCCDANFVATKCVHFESVHFINNQLLSTANAKDINTDYCITN